MQAAIDKVVTPFLAAADAALGAGYSALLYGSAARGDYVPGRSDINLMLVLDDPSPSRLRALAPAFEAWRKAAAEPPLLISRAEWARASDVFPIEITDMRAGYRVLRGPDPLADTSVDSSRLTSRSTARSSPAISQGPADGSTITCAPRNAASGVKSCTTALSSGSTGTTVGRRSSACPSIRAAMSRSSIAASRSDAWRRIVVARSR